MTPSETIDILAECAAEVYEDERNIWTVLPHEDKQRHRRVVKQVLETLRAITTKPTVVYHKPTPPALPYDPNDPVPDKPNEQIVKAVCDAAGVEVGQITRNYRRDSGSDRARTAIAFILRYVTLRRHPWVEIAQWTMNSGNEHSAEAIFRKRPMSDQVMAVAETACARLGMEGRFNAAKAQWEAKHAMAMDGRNGGGVVGTSTVQ